MKRGREFSQKNGKTNEADHVLRGAGASTGAQRAKRENEFLFRVFIQQSTRVTPLRAPARNPAGDVEGSSVHRRVHRGLRSLAIEYRASRTRPVAVHSGSEMDRKGVEKGPVWGRFFRVMNSQVIIESQVADLDGRRNFFPAEIMP